MVSEIKINPVVLEEKIQKLRALRNACNEISVKEEEVCGSGQVIGAITALDEEYAIIKTSILRLMDNSILFFEKVKYSVIRADEQASEKLH